MKDYNGKDINEDFDLAIQLTCEVFDVDRDQLLSKNRRRMLVLARNSLCYTMRVHLSYGLEAVRCLVGYKNHTSVMHACNVYKIAIESNFNDVYDELCKTHLKLLNNHSVFKNIITLSNYREMVVDLFNYLNTEIESLTEEISISDNEDLVKSESTLSAYKNIMSKIRVDNDEELGDSQYKLLGHDNVIDLLDKIKFDWL
tara:strand:- start:1227 stop:1826 length:600 start_codon:yes stop_codon:yes gene_type:complete